VHFPARPALLEAEQADQPPLVEIVGMALPILLIPFEAGELRFRDGLGSKAEVDREVVERFAADA